MSDRSWHRRLGFLKVVHILPLFGGLLDIGF
jgi:hypothetical protein